MNRNIFINPIPKIRFILFSCLAFSCLNLYSQQDTVHVEYKQPIHNNVYTFNNYVDIPITAIGSAWSIYAMTKIYDKGASTEQQVLDLNINNVNAFDRKFAVYKYSRAIDKNSYYPFYAAFPYPLIVLLSKHKMRSDFFKLSFLYLETMSVTGIFGFSGPYFVDKYRPYAYSAENTMDQREGQNAKNSFYSGHVEVVATSTFFAAKVYSDYYPDSKIKWVFYTIATAATLGTGYMRLEAAEHFPTDILLGSGMGLLAGILVPQAHKHKTDKPSMSFLPYTNGSTYGITFLYN